MLVIQLLIPREGVRCVDPRTRQALPPEGAEVELDPYWHRRLADGDVVAKARAAKSIRSTSAARRGEQE
jgi:hypothetical protein